MKFPLTNGKENVITQKESHRTLHRYKLVLYWEERIRKLVKLHATNTKLDR